MTTPAVSRRAAVGMAAVGVLGAGASVVGAIAIAAARDWAWLEVVRWGRGAAPLWLATLLLLFVGAMGVVLAIWSILDLRRQGRA